MHKRYLVLTICFISTLFASDKQERKYDNVRRSFFDVETSTRNIIEVLNLETKQLKKIHINKSRISNEYDAFNHTPDFVKGLASTYKELKERFEEVGKRNLELEAIVIKLSEQLAQCNNSPESCASASSTETSPATDIACSPTPMPMAILDLNDNKEEPTKDESTYCPCGSKNSCTARFYIHQSPVTTKKLPLDLYDINYRNESLRLGNLPF